MRHFSCGTILLNCQSVKKYSFTEKQKHSKWLEKFKLIKWNAFNIYKQLVMILQFPGYKLVPHSPGLCTLCNVITCNDWFRGHLGNHGICFPYRVPANSVQICKLHAKSCTLLLSLVFFIISKVP